MSNVLRSVPSVNELLETPQLKSLVARVNQNVVVARVRQFVDDMRSQVQSAAAQVPVPAVGELAQRIADWIATQERPGLVPVINATGNLLPDNLGRAPLAEEAIAAIAAVARGYAAIDFDLTSAGSRPRAAGALQALLNLAGSEAATVVNHQAAGTLISLAALAGGREVVVARGQLVADGEQYRLPALIGASGAVLREVGTTNSARVSDYAAAIGPQTAAVLHVHAASYVFQGSWEQPPLAELIALARKNGVPLISELGDGSLSSLARYDLADVPVMADVLRAGADLALCSGDRWLGGPQCGIIAGRRALVDRIVQHPRFAAVTADKLTLAALAATLKLHADADAAERLIPVLSMLATPVANLQNRAERLAPQIAATGVCDVQVVPGWSFVSGASVARYRKPTVCLALKPITGTLDALVTMLRAGTPAVIGRMEDGQFLLDLRSVPPREDALLVAAFEPKSAAILPDAAIASAATPDVGL